MILTPVPVPRESFPPGYWNRVDEIANGDDLEDIEDLGAGLLDPKLSENTE